APVAAPAAPAAAPVADAEAAAPVAPPAAAPVPAPTSAPAAAPDVLAAIRVLADAAGGPAGAAAVRVDPAALERPLVELLDEAARDGARLRLVDPAGAAVLAAGAGGGAGEVVRSRALALSGPLAGWRLEVD